MKPSSPSARPPELDRLAVDRAAIAVFWAGQDSSFVDVNQAASALLGYSRSQLRRMCVSDVDLEVRPGTYHAERWLPMQARGSAFVETCLRHASGDIIPAELFLNFVELGSQSYICCFARDLRAEKQVIGELRRTEELFRALMENTLDLVTILDAQGIIRYANPAMSRLLGFSAAERTGVFAFDLVHPDDLAAVLAEFQQVASTGRPGSAVEVRLLHKNGEWRYFDAAATNLLSNPAVRGIVVHSRDVTDRKRAEFALRQSETELRALAGRLIQAEEDASRLLSLELHDDFTQRLTAASLALTELERRSASASDPSSLQLHRRIQSLVESVSEDIRLLAHRLHPAVIDVLGLAEALRQLCAESAPPSGPAVTFRPRRGSHSPIERGQALCLYRVAQEALRNALRHSGASTISISLSATDGCVRLSIRDNGAGFSTDFDPPVHGLGLTGMKERVRLAGGRFTVDSRPGRGAHLTAIVPAAGPPA